MGLHIRLWIVCELGGYGVGGLVGHGSDMIDGFDDG